VDWAHTFTLAESAFLMFIGVAGVAFGLGTLLLNRQHVISTMEQRFRSTADEARSGFRRDLELQLMRMQSRYTAELAEIRSDLALARGEAQMQAAAALRAERRIEKLEADLRAGITINAGNDVAVGRDLAGGNHTETP